MRTKGQIKIWLLRLCIVIALTSVIPVLLHARNKERVVGFEIHVASGRIAALPNIPIGWNMSVDNNPSWTTEIEASSKVGAAAVTSAFFREFLFIEKDESLGAPLQISGEIVVTQDFATERRIQIGMKDFSIKQTRARHSGSCS